MLGNLRFEVVDVDSAVVEALHLNHVHAANSCRGGVGAVGRVGNEHLSALVVAAAVVIGAYDHKSCELAVCTGAGIESEAAQSCQLGKRLLQVVVDEQRALTRCGALLRMQCGKLFEGPHLLVQGRIVFHSARSQGIEAVVNAEVVVAQIGVVAHYCQFVALGQPSFLAASESLRQLGGGVLGSILRQRVTFATAFRKLENQIAI